MDRSTHAAQASSAFSLFLVAHRYFSKRQGLQDAKTFSCNFERVSDFECRISHAQHAVDAGFLHVALLILAFGQAKSDLQAHSAALPSLAALLRFVEHEQSIVLETGALQLRCTVAVGRVVIPFVAASQLELLRNARSGAAGDSLAGVLGDHLRTPMGNRLLRRELQNPPADTQAILGRHQVVEVLVSSPTLFQRLGAQLVRFGDVEGIISGLAQRPKLRTPDTCRDMARTAIHLKHVLHLLPALVETLVASAEPALQSVAGLLAQPGLEAIAASIESYLEDEVQQQRQAMKQQREELFAVRTGMDGNLDMIRQVYIHTAEGVERHHADIREEWGLAVELSHASKRGFFFTLPPKAASDLPTSAIQCTQLKNGKITCSTETLVSLNGRLQEAVVNIYEITDAALMELRDEVRPHLECLQQLAETIANLDLFTGFASFVLHSAGEYVRPRLLPPEPAGAASSALAGAGDDDDGGDDDETSDVVTGRHRGGEAQPVMSLREMRNPLVELLQPDRRFVPTSFEMLRPGPTLHLLTGPNCAGKSTLLRGIALIHVLAQVGCFVPAREAMLTVIDRLDVRMGASDDMERHASSFLVEMEEMIDILSSASSSSLVLIDELGSSTSADDGAATAWAICEELVRAKAPTFFATHFHQLTELASAYPSKVVNLAMGALAASDGSGLVYTYALERGRTPLTSSYGVELAAQMGFPQQLVSEARRMSQRLAAALEDQAHRAEEAAKMRQFVAALEQLRELCQEGGGGALSAEQRQAVRETLHEMRGSFQPVLQRLLAVAEREEDAGAANRAAGLEQLSLSTSYGSGGVPTGDDGGSVCSSIPDVGDQPTLAQAPDPTLLPSGGPTAAAAPLVADSSSGSAPGSSRPEADGGAASVASSATVATQLQLGGGSPGQLTGSPSAAATAAAAAAATSGEASARMDSSTTAAATAEPAEDLEAVATMMLQLSRHTQ